MASLSSLEKRQFEDLLEMKTGYVMSFSNGSFAKFFNETIGIDIYSDTYANDGDSKSNRLCSFWKQESDNRVETVLRKMLEILEYENEDIKNHKAYKPCQKIIARLNPTKAEKSTLEKQEFLSQDLGNISVKSYLLII